jgi:hypothetical protein
MHQHLSAVFFIIKPEEHSIRVYRKAIVNARLFPTRFNDTVYVDGFFNKGLLYLIHETPFTPSKSRSLREYYATAVR